MGTLGQVETGTWWVQTVLGVVAVEIDTPLYVVRVSTKSQQRVICEFKPEHKTLIQTSGVDIGLFGTSLKPLKVPEVGQFWEDDLNLVYRIFKVDHNTVWAQDVECVSGCKIEKPIHSWMRYFKPHVPTLWERL